jgi:hypothetical protein
MNIVLGSITPKLTYIVVVQGTEPQMGIEPSTALLLDMCLPLSHHNIVMA